MDQFGVGISFMIEEHEEILRWNEHRPAGWPRFELALNYPGTAEMLGIVEEGWETPTFFMWRTEDCVIVSAFSDDTKIKFASFQNSLNALSLWSAYLLSGYRASLKNCT